MERTRRGQGTSYTRGFVERWTRIRRRIFSTSSSSSSQSCSAKVKAEEGTDINTTEERTVTQRQKSIRDDPECKSLLREYQEAKKRNVQVHRQYEEEKQKFKEKMRRKIERIEQDTKETREKVIEIKSINEESPDVIDICSEDEHTTILVDSNESSDSEKTLVEDFDRNVTHLSKVQRIIEADWKLRADCRVILERIVPPKKKKPTIRNVQIIKSKIRIAKDKIVKVSNEQLRKLAKATIEERRREDTTKAIVPYGSHRRNEPAILNLQGETKDKETSINKSEISLEINNEYYDIIAAIKKEENGPPEEYIIVEELEVNCDNVKRAIPTGETQDENNNQGPLPTQPVGKLMIDGVSPISPDTPEGGMQPVCEADPISHDEKTPTKDELQHLEELLTN